METKILIPVTAGMNRVVLVMVVVVPTLDMLSIMDLLTVAATH